MFSYIMLFYLFFIALFPGVSDFPACFSAKGVSTAPARNDGHSPPVGRSLTKSLAVDRVVRGAVLPLQQRQPSSSCSSSSAAAPPPPSTPTALLVLAVKRCGGQEQRRTRKIIQATLVADTCIPSETARTK
jgi:hypothetical protein